MKHAFWDRFLIILCTVLLIAIAAFGLGMVTGLIPVALVIEWINLVFSDRNVRILFSACAVSIIVLAMFHFWIVLPRGRNRQANFAIQETEHGTLKISVKALEHLVQKCLAQHPEMTPVYSNIHSDEHTVRVDLRVQLQSDINIPLAIAALQKQIKQYIEACSGVDVDEVRVVVEATTPAQPEMDTPYRIPAMMQPQLPKLNDVAPAAVMEPEAAYMPASAPEPLEEAAWMDGHIGAEETAKESKNFFETELFESAPHTDDDAPVSDSEDAKKGE